MISNPTSLRRLYILCYAIGTCGSLLTLALLLWVAFCIAIEAEPLASIAFLPDMPAPVVLLLLIAIMFVSAAAWQYGATYHQQYEQAKKSKP